MPRPGRITSRVITPVPTELEVVWAPQTAGRFTSTENLFPLPGLEIRNTQPAALSLYRLSYPGSFRDNIYNSNVIYMGGGLSAYPLKTKCRPLYLKTQSVPRSKHTRSRL
jgi:hypothetical protein